jgi:hypothetical protein
MLDIIIIWVLTLLSLAIGFIAGYIVKSGKSLKEINNEVKRKLDDSPVGVVYRPTQQQILENENPVIKEGKQAFKKLLDTLNIKK